MGRACKERFYSNVGQLGSRSCAFYYNCYYYYHRDAQRDYLNHDLLYHSKPCSLRLNIDYIYWVKEKKIDFWCVEKICVYLRRLL